MYKLKFSKMERISRIAKTLRNNWKKSVFGAIAAGYVLKSGKERYEIYTIMRAACEEASKYGDAQIDRDRNPKVVTVILNPIANQRSAKSEYEKYCEPILHLAGLEVELISTKSEGNAKEIAEQLHGTEAIIIAGGDGTVAETVTGLLRRKDRANEFPIGILPLGKTNTLGNILFPGGEGTDRIKQLIKASMAVVKEHTEWKDAMKIEPIATEEDINPRPTYALCSIEWGAFRDATVKRDKYWFVGSLRDYATFIFNGYKSSLTWDCKGTLKYSPPCSGCSNCVEKQQQIKSKWSFLVPITVPKQANDLSAVINENCTKTDEFCFKSCELKVTTPNIEDDRSQVPSLKLYLGKSNYSYTEFVSDGWKRIKSDSRPQKSLEARTIEFVPDCKGNKLIAIDSEEYEVKPMKITLLPKIVKLFCNYN